MCKGYKACYFDRPLVRVWILDPVAIVLDPSYIYNTDVGYVLYSLHE
jgi:hypothetical protein